MVAFTDNVALVVAGALLWGAAVGIQESTLRAVVADLVAPPRRATAYGIFAAGLGAATAVGGALTGWLYDTSIPALITTVAAIQIAAIALAAAVDASLWLGKPARPARRGVTGAGLSGVGDSSLSSSGVG